ncbi:uncharacterized protein PAC_11703 [Phialocephala subalpina]|uniref:BTB domain-containing protein n=1 Tax=Phialocephala subalpina TaxID=576137 RepID=A0A1L7X9Z0_9HELO|nr:uncharacterized protein PAC_11703 [Phialocephala subalpina]
MNTPAAMKTPAPTRPDCGKTPATAREAESPGLFVRPNQERTGPSTNGPAARAQGRPPRRAPAVNRENSPDFEIVRVEKRDAAAMTGGEEGIRKPKKPKSNPNLAMPDAEMVSILVGPEELKFSVPRHVITHYSTYFEDQFNNHESAHGETKILRVKEVDDQVFGLFVHWNYFQVIEHTARATEPARGPELMELAKLWTAAGEWNVPTLQNEAMGMLLKMIINPNLPIERGAPIWEFFKFAYGAQGRAPLKSLSIEKVVRIAPRLVPLRQRVDDFPKGLFVDMTARLVRDVGRLRARPDPELGLFLVRENDE